MTILFALGDFGYATEDESEIAVIWWIFAIMAVSVPLVMMNVLIALVGEAYNVVMA
jgi:hypothetical protein